MVSAAQARMVAGILGGPTLPLSLLSLLSPFLSFKTNFLSCRAPPIFPSTGNTVSLVLFLSPVYDLTSISPVYSISLSNLSLPWQTNLRQHMQEKVRGEVLCCAILGDTAQLSSMDALWPSLGAPSQHSRPHHQWCWRCHRAHLRRPIPPTLYWPEAPPCACCLPRRAPLCGSNGNYCPFASLRSPLPLPHHWIIVRLLRHDYVRSATLRHG